MVECIDCKDFFEKIIYYFKVKITNFEIKDPQMVMVCVTCHRQ